jgi:glutamate-1-semialdehyde 2,1-aminomutase
VSSSEKLYERARALIPGGTGLLSKQPERFLPGRWPAYYRRAKGVEVEDLDGRVFVDVSIHAVGACPLGYADPDVEQAVIEAIRAGNMSTLNCPEEVELAELLCSLHPYAEQVRYARCGGEAMTIAVRVARAATGRDRIAFSGYHGWHDWYLAANLADPTALDAHLLPDLDTAGVPKALEGSALPFDWGSPESLDAVVSDHGEDLAAIVIEPARSGLPEPGYLEHVRAVADRLGCVLIFDEISSGFRVCIGGVHLRLGVEPDVSVFAKAMSNGYPMAAVIGRRAVMETAARGFISSTYWSERIGPTAALATIRKLDACNVPEHLVALGEKMRAGWHTLAETHGLPIDTKGIAPMSSFGFCDRAQAKAMMSLYTRCMLDRGFLASAAFYPSYAHSEEHVKSALEAGDEAFATIATACQDGSAGLARALDGPEAVPGPARREG